LLKRFHPTSLQIVLGTCVFVSLAAGAWGFHMLQVSQVFIKTSLLGVATKGKNATVEQCIDVTMHWYQSCEAMKSLCESSVPRVMQECLVAQDRSGDCKELGLTTMNTHFGFQECEARKVTRFTRKACANAYRAIDHRCADLAKVALPEMR
jgi:hypothetical protein